MKFLKRKYFIFFGIIFLVAACAKKQASPDQAENYIGNWEVSGPQGQNFYMSLKPDGSGMTTRGDGEFGKWQFQADHIELEWYPKSFTLHFNPGQAVPLKASNSPENNAGRTTAVKVDKIP